MLSSKLLSSTEAKARTIYRRTFSLSLICWNGDESNSKCATFELLLFTLAPIFYVLTSLFQAENAKCASHWRHLGFWLTSQFLPSKDIESDSARPQPSTVFTSHPHIHLSSRPLLFIIYFIVDIVHDSWQFLWCFFFFRFASIRSLGSFAYFFNFPLCDENGTQRLACIDFPQCLEQEQMLYFGWLPYSVPFTIMFGMYY